MLAAITAATMACSGSRSILRSDLVPMDKQSYSLQQKGQLEKYTEHAEKLKADLEKYTEEINVLLTLTQGWEKHFTNNTDPASFMSLPSPFREIVLYEKKQLLQTVLEQLDSLKGDYIQTSNDYTIDLSAVIQRIDELKGSLIDVYVESLKEFIAVYHKQKFSRVFTTQFAKDLQKEIEKIDRLIELVPGKKVVLDQVKGELVAIDQEVAKNVVKKATEPTKKIPRVITADLIQVVVAQTSTTPQIAKMMLEDTQGDVSRAVSLIKGGVLSSKQRRMLSLFSERLHLPLDDAKKALEAANWDEAAAAKKAKKR